MFKNIRSGRVPTQKPITSSTVPTKRDRARWELRSTRYFLEEGLLDGSDLTNAIEHGVDSGLSPEEIVRAASEGYEDYKLANKERK